MNTYCVDKASASALFISGIHMDLQCRFSELSRPGVSNPGNATFIPGGAGLNAASIFAKLGGKCTIAGLVGDDEHGAKLLDIVHERNVQSALHKVNGKNTGIYVSMIEPNGNVATAFADLHLADELNAQWLINKQNAQLSEADIWFLSANLDANSLAELVSQRKTFGSPLITAASISPSKAPRLKEVLSTLDVFFTNLGEAQAILGNNNLTAQDCVEIFIQKDVKAGTLSNGKDTLWVWNSGDTKQFQPKELSNPVDVTGAGDALAGAFLFGLANNVGLMESAQFAIDCAQCVVGINGPYAATLALPDIPKPTP